MQPTGHTIRVAGKHTAFRKKYPETHHVLSINSPAPDSRGTGTDFLPAPPYFPTVKEAFFRHIKCAEPSSAIFERGGDCN